MRMTLLPTTVTDHRSLRTTCLLTTSGVAIRMQTFQLQWTDDMICGHLCRHVLKELATGLSGLGFKGYGTWPVQLSSTISCSPFFVKLRVPVDNFGGNCVCGLATGGG